jgi:endonuclease-8
VPEGDTIFRAAQTLQKALAGQIVTGFTSVYPALTRIDADRPLKGRTIESVRSLGKHLLMSFSGDLVLHTHMRMHGSWHIYRPGERWQRPHRDMRIVVETERFVAVAFNVPVAELLTAADIKRHEALQALGPDLTDPTFDRQEVLRRMRAHDQQAIHEVLLNQRVVSGIGNVFKSEVLFEAAVDPFTATSQLSDATLHRLIDVALKQMRMNVLDRDQALSPAIGRHTTGSMNPREQLWVYSRGGEPCRRCGTPIRSRASGTDARLTYWCAQCQKS